MFTIQIINNFRISNSEKPKPIEHWYLQHRYTGKSKPLKHGENSIGNTPTIRGFLDDIVLKTKYISPKQCKIYTHKDNTDYVIIFGYVSNKNLTSKLPTFQPITSISNISHSCLQKIELI